MVDKFLFSPVCSPAEARRPRPFGKLVTCRPRDNPSSRFLTALMVGWLSLAVSPTNAGEALDAIGENTPATYSKNLVRVGAYRFFVNDVADDIAGIFTPPNASANVKDTTSFALSYARFLTENISVQLAAGYPPKFAVAGSGSIAPLGEIASVTALNPTLFLNYHFFGAHSSVRPYLGVGVNYTNFVDEQPSTSLEAGLGGATSISLSSFVALAVTAGIDIKLQGPWVASISASYLSSDTTATITTGGIDRTMAIELDPVTLFVGLGYQY